MPSTIETFRGGDLRVPDRAVPTRVDGLRRHADGHWSMLMTVDAEVPLPDGRRIVVKRQLRVRATGQIGRKPRGV